MGLFNRMATSWFPPQAEPTRQTRVSKWAEPPEPVKATVDERTAMAAQEIMENGSFDRVMKRLKAEAFREFSSSAEGEAGAYSRDKAHTKITALDEIEAAISVMADEMKLHKRSSEN